MAIYKPNIVIKKRYYSNVRVGREPIRGSVYSWLMPHGKIWVWELVLQNLVYLLYQRQLRWWGSLAKAWLVWFLLNQKHLVGIEYGRNYHFGSSDTGSVISHIGGNYA